MQKTMIEQLGINNLYLVVSRLKDSLATSVLLVVGSDYRESPLGQLDAAVAQRALSQYPAEDSRVLEVVPLAEYLELGGAVETDRCFLIQCSNLKLEKSHAFIITSQSLEQALQTGKDTLNWALEKAGLGNLKHGWVVTSVVDCEECLVAEDGCQPYAQEYLVIVNHRSGHSENFAKIGLSHAQHMAENASRESGVSRALISTTSHVHLQEYRNGIPQEYIHKKGEVISFGTAKSTTQGASR